MGLVGFSDEMSRKYGGCGLALNSHSTEVTLKKRNDAGIRVESNTGVFVDSIHDFLSSRKMTGVDITFGRLTPRHVGLGSGTALKLAIVEAYSELYSLGLTKHELIMASGRGRTSGVGIATYFEGGVSLDLGVKNDSVYEPSSSSNGPLSVGLSRLDWPESWCIALISPSPTEEFDSVLERDFFSRNSPICAKECLLSAYGMFVEIPAGILLEDFSQFKSGLRATSCNGFKLREIDFWPRQKELIVELNSCSHYAATLSSLGPTVCVFCEEEQDAKELVSRFGTTNNVEISRCQNTGRSISH